MVRLVDICVPQQVYGWLFHVATVVCVGLVSAEYFIEQASEAIPPIYVYVGVQGPEKTPENEPLQYKKVRHTRYMPVRYSLCVHSCIAL